MTGRPSFTMDRQARRLACCEGLLFQRRLVGRFIGFSLCSDPAWDMILELYAAQIRGYALSLSSLAMAGNVPATTGLRCIRALEGQHMVERVPDRSDARRTHVLLTPATLMRVEQLLDAMEEIPRRLRASRANAPDHDLCADVSRR